MSRKLTWNKMVSYLTLFPSRRKRTLSAVIFRHLPNSRWKIHSHFRIYGSNFAFWPSIALKRSCSKRLTLLCFSLLVHFCMFWTNRTNCIATQLENNRQYVYLLIMNKSGCLFLYKYLFKTGFLDVLQLFQLTLMKGDKGVNTSKAICNFLLLCFIFRVFHCCFLNIGFTKW